jgi:hypothetical protein
MAAKDLLKELFPTTDPREAARDRTGAREASRPAAKERREGDYIPVIAVIVGIALLALAFLKPVSLSDPEPQQNDRQNSESDWQTTEQDYYR